MILMKNKKYLTLILISLLIVSALIVKVFNSEDTTKHIGYTAFNQYVDSKEIEKVIISQSENLVFYLNNDKTKYITDNPRNPQLKEQLLLKDIKVIEGEYISSGSIIQGLVSVVFFCIAFFLVYRNMVKQRSKAKMGFSAESVNEETTVDFGFDKIAGNQEAKESVSDIIEFIKNPEKFEKYGARMPKGIIFYGSPGTGKTLLAKAIAGEAGVPFFSASGSDFVQMYVGVGASRIRDLFKKARESKKAVIFIDEIDAMGKKRSSQGASGNDEREQTLNALLTEMSGFSSSEGIIVIAATNRLDILDDALLRPGRFDRQVEISLPDLSAREHILQLYTKDKPLSQEVSIQSFAKQTVFFSGAMLENLVNEAAIFAAKKGEGSIDTDDMNKAYYTILAGSEKMDRSNVKEHERKTTAYHEAGHALVGKIALPENTITKITIIPSTKGAGGFCVNIPPDKMYHTKSEILSQVMVSLAGRAAEEIIFGNDFITTGASNDIEKATALVKDLVTRYGMSDKIGLINTNISDAGNIVFEECKAIIDGLYEDTKNMIVNNIDKLEDLTQALLDKETLDEDEIYTII